MKFLLPFREDSSLIFASRMSRELQARGQQVELIQFVDRDSHGKISSRQLEQYAPGVSFRKVRVNDIIKSGALMDADAVCMSRLVYPVLDLLEDDDFKNTGPRPCFMAFNAGLDFTPAKGARNRRNFDAYFLNKRSEVDWFRAEFAATHWQHVSFGHPYFLMPDHMRKPESKNIYFFAQAISPRSFRSRRHVVEVLAELARAHPDSSVVIKLRHQPDENRTHVHREAHSYPDILKMMGDRVPRNLTTSAVSMEQALKSADYAVTCTSTAAFDAISAGVPTGIFLDYDQFGRDPLRDPMARECAESRLILSKDDLINLKFMTPDPVWMLDRFRTPDLFDEVIDTAAKFKGLGLAGLNYPEQVRRSKRIRSRVKSVIRLLGLGELLNFRG